MKRRHDKVQSALRLIGRLGNQLSAMVYSGDLSLQSFSLDSGSRQAHIQFVARRRRQRGEPLTTNFITGPI